MRHFGYAFSDRDIDDNIVVDVLKTGDQKKFKLLHVFEFNSDRKRMSILVRDPTDHKIKLFIKGADSIIKSRLDMNQLS
jgi:phospholipid-translocating ATPase